MIAVSTDFKTAIKNTEREIKGYVTVNYTEPIGIVADNYPTNGADISVATQIYNVDGIMTNYASFEANYFKTDGSMILPNDPTGYTNTNVGYISDAVFDTVFESEILGFSDKGISIHFMEDYPIDGRIEVVYNVDGTPTSVYYNFTDNDSNHLIVKAGGDPNYSSYPVLNAYLRITDFSSTEHRVRITSIKDGIVGMYQNRELLGFDVNEEVNKLVEEVPTNDCIVTLNNYNDQFNPISTTGLVSYLKTGIVVKPYIGCVLASGLEEYVAMGKFYLDTWQNNTDYTTTFNCVNIMQQIKEKEFVNNAEKQILDLSLSEAEFEDYLDSNYSYTFNYAYGLYLGAFTYLLSCKTLMEFLQPYALRCQSILYADRDETVNIKAIPTVSQETIAREEMLTDAKYDTINKINTVEIPRLISEAKDLSVSTSEVILSTNVILTSASQIFRFTTDTDTYLYALAVTQTGGTSASIVDLGHKMMFIKVTGTIGATVSIEVTGQTGSLSNKEISELYTNKATTDNEYRFIFGGELNSAYAFDGIADHILDNAYQYKSVVDYIGDPSLEAGDIITIETLYGNKNIFIQKNSFKFDGGLSGYIEGVGN